MDSGPRLQAITLRLRQPSLSSRHDFFYHRHHRHLHLDSCGMTGCRDCLRWARRYRRRHLCQAIEAGKVCNAIPTFGRLATSTSTGTGNALKDGNGAPAHGGSKCNSIKTATQKSSTSFSSPSCMEHGPWVLSKSSKATRLVVPASHDARALETPN